MTVPLSYNFNNLLARKVTTLLASGGIALVVLIFVAVLMLAEGFRRTMIATGSPDNAIVLRAGANAELVSSIDRDQAQIIRAQPEVAQDAAGRPIGAAETITIISIPRRNGTGESNVVVRGVTSDSMAMRPVAVVEGRMWRSGLSEVIAGRLISRKYRGCQVGETLRFGGRDWTVVGIFDAERTGFESEVWGDNNQINAAIRRESFSTVTLRLRDRSAIESLRSRLEGDPRFNVQVRSEREWYDDQSRTIAGFIRYLGIFVTLIFSVAAILAAMLTMFATVGARTAEIGTLRALGFPRRSILLSFVVESTLIGIAGGVIGLVPGFFLQFASFSTTNWASFSEIAWRLSLNGAIVVSALGFAAAMGFLGGLLPAVRAARLPVVEAIREG